ncbi:hypothetical protein SAY86_014548 [Trapa natans]|uniref:SnoaL-like domain-containing protein n=1 Tax=Trapa natans TaxID=22666 RepID=A0AAN7QR08_TRANT|nr:hypothetical protein SAY86_014548 [Trapa natans]
MALYPHQQSYHHLTSAMKPTDSSYSIHYTFPSRSPIHTILFCKGRSHKKCISRYSSPHGGQEEEDSDRVLRAVLKLYDAIKNKNVGELSEVFGDECRCGCNFLPLPGSFKGKKQVLAFFSYLMRTLGDTIKLEIRPTTQDGMTVGVSWKLEWKKSSLPLGKGFSFHICQIYQGKVFIRNVEMMMEPLFQIQPLVEVGNHLR